MTSNPVNKSCTIASFLVSFSFGFYSCDMSDREETLKFIQYYREHAILWDSNRKDYTIKRKRNIALDDMAKKTGMTAKQVKNKIKSLRSYFSKEHSKVMKSGDDENYECTWFAYGPLAFILDVIAPRDTKSTFNCLGESLVDTSILEEQESEDGDSTADIEGTLKNEEYAHLKAEDNEPGEEKDNFARPISNKRNLKRAYCDEQEEKAFNFLDVAAKKWSNRDECSIFGEMVAGQLRKLNRRNQTVAKHEIQNIIFKFEMEEIDHSSPTSSYFSSY